jgi:hypothetical protein
MLYESSVNISVNYRLNCLYLLQGFSQTPDMSIDLPCLLPVRLFTYSRAVHLQSSTKVHCNICVPIEPPSLRIWQNILFYCFWSSITSVLWWGKSMRFHTYLSAEVTPCLLYYLHSSWNSIKFTFFLKIVITHRYATESNILYPLHFAKASRNLSNLTFLLFDLIYYVSHLFSPVTYIFPFITRLTHRECNRFWRRCMTLKISTRFVHPPEF